MQGQEFGFGWEESLPQYSWRKIPFYYLFNSHHDYRPQTPSEGSLHTYAMLDPQMITVQSEVRLTQPLRRDTGQKDAMHRQLEVDA
jgi:hypothetical protein